MNAHIIDQFGNVETVSDSDFFCRAFGHSPRVRTAEEQARIARARLIETFHRAAYLQANREREEVIREGGRDGEDYADWHRRLNEPFIKAANAVNKYVEELQRRLAA